MATLDFPSSPTNGQLYVGTNGTTYRYDSTMLCWQPLTDTSQTAALTSGIQAAMSAEDNLLINGGMEIWQRGTSGFSSVGAVNVKTADRWQIQAGTGGTVFGNQNIQPPVAGGVDRRFAFAFQRNVAGSGNSVFFQFIENARTAAGQTVTVSFDVYSAAASSGWTVQFNQGFGTGGSPSSVVATVSPTFSVAGTSTWERKVITIALPDVGGKTFGTNGDDYLLFMIGIPPAAGTTTWYFSNLDLRLGTVAPAQYLRRPIQQELALCQRYYQTMSSIIFTGNVPTASTTFYGMVSFNTRMRAAPVLTISNVTYANASGLAQNSTTQPSHVRLQATDTAGGYAWASCDLALDAEL